MKIRKAHTPRDFEAIHRLNYQTFAREIPQHPPNGEEILVDRFHHLNTYFVVEDGTSVVGMVCYNTTRPFSLDGKINNLDQFLPPHQKMAEIRLLAIQKDYRRPSVAFRLLQHVCKDLLDQQVDLAVISGTTLQIKLYRAMGFHPFGELVGTPGAYYQPMYITPETLRHDFRNH